MGKFFSSLKISVYFCSSTTFVLLHFLVSYTKIRQKKSTRLVRVLSRKIPARTKQNIRNRTGTQGATLSTCHWWDAPHVPVSRHSPVLFLVRSIKGNFLTSPHWHQQPLATPPRDVSHVPSLGHCFQLALHRTLAGLAMYLSLPASPADSGEDYFRRFPLRWVHLTFAFYI